MSLIEESKQELKKINIEELQNAGIERDIKQIPTHAHRVVTYPPLAAMADLDPQKIYHNEANSSTKEINLYLHLPFCTGKCLYCTYVTMANQNKEFIDFYLDNVEKEMDLLLKYPNLNKTTLTSIYVGGGTPTYLSPKQLERVFKLLNSRFKIKENAEITVEASPETLLTQDGKEKLKTLLDNGVNRLSIGFQSFDDDILRLIGRRHNSNQAIEAYNLARKIGFANINIDLISGLPKQTLEIFQKDLEKIKELSPNSITRYPLTITEGSALWLMHEKNKLSLPTREELIIIDIMTSKFLQKAGYLQKHIWWYIKKPKYILKAHSQRFGKLGEILALGVSGYSFIDNYNYFNYRTINEYLNLIEKNIIPVWKGEKLLTDELIRRLIVLGLRTGINKEFFKSRFGKEPKEFYSKTWEKLKTLNLVEEDEKFIKLSFKGSLFADEITKQFFSIKVKKALENK